jgi:prolipoprotein diacylglyceryltransferase
MAIFALKAALKVRRVFFMIQKIKGFNFLSKIFKPLQADPISNRNRLSIILGAIVGALVGSRLVGFLENPIAEPFHWVQLLHTKSIMGGLFGGLLGVEGVKYMIKEKQSSGDLFTYPIIVGIIIGRIGCFLSGTNEFTYGKETGFFAGMDLGDGLYRHPTALYEIVFLVLLFVFLRRMAFYTRRESGLLFKLFMIAYFGFRFFIEFLKPNVFFVLGLSSIQWICILCWIYYLPTFKRLATHAYQKVYLLRLHP